MSRLGGIWQPLGVNNRSRATHRRAHGVGQFLSDGDVVLLLDATADGDQNRVFRDIDITRLGYDRLQIAASRRQSTDLRRLVDNHTAKGSACQRLKRARTKIKDRTR